MEKEIYNATKIIDVIIEAAKADVSLSPQMAKIDAIVVATNDEIIATTDTEHLAILDHGGRILLVQVWPQSSRVSLVAVRRLADEHIAMPWALAKVEYAIDWASELSLSGVVPLFAHIVEADRDDPVFFNHSVIGHTGRSIEYYEVNVHDLRERFPRAMERIADRMMFLVSVLPTPNARQRGWS